MKKIMACALILLPLIVLLILFVSGAVVSLSTYVKVEYVEFVDEEIVLQKLTDDPVAYQLKVNVFPKIANNQKVLFTSDNSDIARVDSENAMLYGESFGETYIYALSDENQTINARVKVIVTDDKMHRVSVDNAPELLLAGETFQLKASWIPLEVANPKILWTSSNAELLSVSPDGVLTANKTQGGVATITATSEANPNATFSFDVKVKVPVSDIYIDDASKVLIGGNVYQFPTVHIEPANAETVLSYTSLDENIASVDQNGKVTFHQKGKVVIYVRAEGCDTVLSKEIESTGGFLTQVTLNHSFMELNYEDFATNAQLTDLTASVLPVDGDLSNLVFASTNSAVVECNEQGIFVRGGGNAQVIATITKPDGTTAEARCTINVSRKASDVVFFNTQDQQTNYIVTTQPTLQLATAVLPADATEKVTEYICSDSQIASVSANGLVTFANGLTSGSVTITAKTPTASNDVTVVYLHQSLSPFRLNGGENSKNVTMPASNREQKVVIAPFVDGQGITQVTFSVDNDQMVKQNGLLFEVVGIGSATIKAMVDGVEFATLTVNSYRKVEAINNLVLTAEWGEVTEQLDIATAYTSAKVVSFAYTLAPANTSLTSATATLEQEDIATIQGNKVVFNKAGKVTLVLSADGVTRKVQIESTFAMVDDHTETATNFTVDCGDTLSVSDFVTLVSPANADINTSVVLSVSNDVATVSNNVLTFVKGGTAYVDITLKTPTGDIFRRAQVFVKQAPNSVELTSADNYVATANVNLADYYVIAPSTANVQKEVTYQIVEGSNYATLTDGVLTFSQAGIAKVSVTTQNGKSNVLSIVYVGSNKVVEATTSVTPIEVGETFIVKAPLNQQSVFAVSGDATLTNGVIAKVTVGTMDGSANATISVNGTNYLFAGVVYATGVELSFNPSDVDANADGSFVTGLKQLDINSAISPAEATTREITYTVSDDTIATMQGNTLVFAKAGKVTLTATVGRATTTIVVESTFGNFTKLSFNGLPTTFNFDNTNSANNVVDISNYVVSAPSQLSKELISVSVSNDVAIAGALSFTLNKGGRFEVTISANGLTATQTVDVNRYATDIIVNGVSASTLTGTQTVQSSFVVLKTAFAPLDANMGTQVSVAVTSGNGKMEGNRLVFGEVNSPVQVTFTMGDIAFVVTYVTTNLTNAVNVDDDVIVVPSNADFTFYSERGDNFEFTEYSASATGNYNIATAGSFQVNFTINGTTVQKTLIVTKQANDFYSVQLADSQNGSDVTVNTDATHVTASSTLGVVFADLGGINADGSIPAVTVAFADGQTDVATTNATYANKVITFGQAGYYKVTLMVEGIDYYGHYEHSYSFTVYTSCGAVEGFTLANPVADSIVIDNVATFNLNDGLAVTTPTYGVVTPNYTFQSNNTSVMTVSNDGIVTVVGTGVATLTVSALNGSGQTISNSITIKVDKFADKLQFVGDSGDAINKITTQNGSLQLNVVSLSNTAVAPTLTGVNFAVVSGNASVDANGKVTLNSTNDVVVVSATAKEGNPLATANITITKLGENVTILPVDATATQFVLNTTDIYYFDCQFGLASATVDLTALPNVTVANATVGTFKANCGGEFAVAVDGVDLSFNVIVTEPVSAVNLKADAPADGYLTAMGASDHTIDLATLYAPTVAPATARDENGAYVVSYAVTNVTGQATVTNGILTFTKAGIVQITFTAGGVSVTRTLESTMGNVKSINVLTNSLNYEYTQGSATLAQGVNYNVVPADAYNTTLKVTCSDNQVATTNGSTLTFVGGGSAELALTFEGSTATAYVNLFVNNRATGIDVFYGDNQVGYIVEDANFKLDYQINFDGAKLSAHSVTFTSDNSAVSVDDQGNVTFNADGATANITIAVVNGTDGATDCSTTIAVAEKHDSVNQIVSVLEETNYTQQSPLVVENAISGGATQKLMLFPISDTDHTSYTYSVMDGSDVVDVDQFGIVTPKKGGYATIQVTATTNTPQGLRREATNSWTKTITIFIHKVVSDLVFGNSNLGDTPLVTSAKQVDVGVTISPVDAAFNKTITYSVDKPQIAEVDTNGLVTFLQAGIVEITITARYGQTVEFTKKVTIDSTFGAVRSYDLTQSGSAVSNGQSYTITTGSTLEFVVSNVVPADYTGTISVTTAQNSSVGISVSANKVTLSANANVTGANVTFNHGGATKNIVVTVYTLANDLDVKLDGTAVGNTVYTMDNVLSFTASVLPLTTTNKNVNFAIDLGAQVTDTGVVTLPNEAYDTYTLTVTSGDGNVSKTISIVYALEITGFTIQKDSTNINGQNFDLDWNVDYFNFQIVTNPTVPSNYYSKFVISSVNGSTGTVSNDGWVTITTKPTSSHPYFDDTITVSYTTMFGETFNASITLHRFGVNTVNFGDHDNATNESISWGYQQRRLVGARSYYDNSVQNYYRMPLKISSPTNANAQMYQNLKWKSSVSSVTFGSVIQIGSDWFMQINFNNFTGCVWDDIYNDNFTPGLVTIEAWDDRNSKLLYTYTFTIVDACNIYDTAGYINARGKVVLQTNFGHNDEKELKNCVYFSDYPLDRQGWQDELYGNGYLINFAYLATTAEPNGDNKYVDWYNDRKICNVRVKGCNNADTKILESTGSFTAAYSEMCNMRYANETGSNADVAFKRCLLHDMSDGGIQITPGGNSQASRVYVEDLVTYSCGLVALSAQLDGFYVKGFLDVYNFVEKETLGSVVAVVGSLVADSILDNNTDMVVSYSYKGTFGITRYRKYINTVIFSGKNDAQDREAYFYNGTDYFKSSDGNSYAGEGLTRRVYDGTIAKASLYSYLTSNTNAPNINQQYVMNSDGTIAGLNDTYLAKQAEKLWRLGN